MIPVLQDKFGRPSKYGGGNCLQACVASLLNLPLESVPHFMIFGKEDWWDAFNLFFFSRKMIVLGWVKGLPPKDNKYYIASTRVKGKNYNHAVICRNQKIVHDPSPVKRKLGDILGYYNIKTN